MHGQVFTTDTIYDRSLLRSWTTLRGCSSDRPRLGCGRAGGQCESCKGERKLRLAAKEVSDVGRSGELFVRRNKAVERNGGRGRRRQQRLARALFAELASLQSTSTAQIYISALNACSAAGILNTARGLLSISHNGQLWGRQGFPSLLGVAREAECV